MDEYLEFTREFYAWTGINLGLYKRPQMERRLTALRDKHGFTSFDLWMDGMKSQSHLLCEFLDRMTINVSEFFRNPERWDALIPFLAQSKRRPVKAWSAACSSGEEPFTLAILLREQLQIPFEIVATDIDLNILSQAKQGRYREHQVKAVPARYLKTFFTQSSGIWQIRRDIVESVTFSAHNLLSDPYPQSLDLIICRNVLIYFTEQAKLHVLSSFSNALTPGGLLFVGSTEQFLNADSFGFKMIAPFLYRKEERSA